MNQWYKLQVTYPKNKSKKEKTSISKKKSHHTSRQILPSIKLRTSKLNKKNVMMTVDSKRKLEAVNTNYTCAQNFFNIDEEVSPESVPKNLLSRSSS